MATKVPPKNRKWPSKPEFKLSDVFPADYIIEYTEKSLQNLGVETIDLQQFHAWEDTWAQQDEWKETVTKLTQQGKVQVGAKQQSANFTNRIDGCSTGYLQYF